MELDLLLNVAVPKQQVDSALLNLPVAPSTIILPEAPTTAISIPEATGNNEELVAS